MWPNRAVIAALETVLYMARCADCFQAEDLTPLAVCVGHMIRQQQEIVDTARTDFFTTMSRCFRRICELCEKAVSLLDFEYDPANNFLRNQMGDSVSSLEPSEMLQILM